VQGRGKYGFCDCSEYDCGCSTTAPSSIVVRGSASSDAAAAPAADSPAESEGAP